MRLSSEQLKEDLGHVLDEVLETGIPVEIERKGHILKIVTERTENSNLSASVRDTLLIIC